MKGDQHMLESNCMRGGMSCERSCQYDTSEPVCTDTTSQVCEDVPEQVTSIKYFTFLKIFSPQVCETVMDKTCRTVQEEVSPACILYLHIYTYLPTYYI